MIQEALLPGFHEVTSRFVSLYPKMLLTLTADNKSRDVDSYDGDDDGHTNSGHDTLKCPPMLGITLRLP